MESCKHNALNSVARKCAKEMAEVGKDNIQALIEITTKHEHTIKALGFNKTDLLVEIGRINGRLEDRSNM
ncbi:hypothetical protein V039C_0058 [Vibrio phage V039C]|nr:hypothetical protein V039C_0058 [Vibrio phage V039C]